MARTDSLWELVTRIGRAVDATTVDVDLGAVLRGSGSFTITDARISAGSEVHVWQAPGPYIGKGTRADEADMDRLHCVAAAGAGQAIVYWRSVEGTIVVDGVAYIRGRVRGYFRFSYLVL